MASPPPSAPAAGRASIDTGRSHWRRRPRTASQHRAASGKIFVSQRSAMAELGRPGCKRLARWYRELQHFGFIVMTEGGALGVNGKGRAPRWRLTEEFCREAGTDDSKAPTRDYLKWD